MGIAMDLAVPVLMAWLYCLGMSWIIERLVNRRRARAVGAPHEGGAPS
ncbi:hypothetical protein ACFPIJ_38240 [Dactylosporangium cerinum]|uniref:Uncharacterized protein n=1 Tax=Dactylosporangium cerinum TaxID=1434730 RepID=A0ABV9W7E0_9ACTN